jgi:hypothetical protein
MRSIVPSCCDDRMVLARRGALSSAALLDFATHLATCADCSTSCRRRRQRRWFSIASPA